MLLSIQGMYEYDNSIFDGFSVPEGLDKNDCINNIVIKCAELEILYTDFAVLKRAIATWSNSNQISWKKMYNTMTVEYNPIWNVDADIVHNRDHTGSNQNVESVQGFNSSNWSDANKDKSDYIENEGVTERRTGNIGVTATQDLIKKEREIAAFNMIGYITESFKLNFCLMIY